MVVTHQHYDQKYNFAELDPLFTSNVSQRLLQDAASGEEVFGVDF